MAAALGDAAALEALLGSAPPALAAALLSGRRRDVSGSTLLHECARHGRLAAAQGLLRRGADASAPDRAGMTPAQVAAARGNAALAAALMSGGGGSGGGGRGAREGEEGDWWGGYEEEEEERGQQGDEKGRGGRGGWERRLFGSEEGDDEGDDADEPGWAARAWERMGGQQQQPQPLQPRGPAPAPPLVGAGLLQPAPGAAPPPSSPAATTHHQAPAPQSDWRARMMAEVASSGMARGVAAARRAAREEQERAEAEERRRRAAQQQQQRQRQQPQPQQPQQPQPQLQTPAAAALRARRLAYEARWAALEARLAAAGGAGGALAFSLALSDVPWPLSVSPRPPPAASAPASSAAAAAAAAAATAAAPPASLRAVLLQGVDGPKALRRRLREELLRWHPDKARGGWLRTVAPADDARRAAAAAQAIARALTELL